MEKILEALGEVLSEEQVKGISASVGEYLEEAKKTLESEYSDKLEEAYAELTDELKNGEGVAEEGYKEAYAIIQDLRNRLETQKSEYETAIEEGYEEAYQMLVSERGKNENIEVEMYENSQNKLDDMKEYIVDKLDEFLQFKGQEIYENARRDVANDPRMVEHKVALDRVVETVSGYLSDDDYASASNLRVEDAHKQIEDLKGKCKILEARNVRLDMGNNKLNEQVRKAAELINEATKSERNGRTEKARNVQGRGSVHNEEIIAEYHNETLVSSTDKEGADTTLVESLGPDALDMMQKLAGVKK